MRFIDSSGVVFDCPVSFGTAATFSPPSTSAINLYTLICHLDTTVSATARVVRVPVPYGGAGSVVQIDVVADILMADGAMTVTGAIGAVNMTNGVATLAMATAAGTLASATPTALNTVVTGNVLKATIGGANTANGRATITFTIQRA